MLTSRSNARVKDWLKLKTKKGRKKSQTYLIEGDHLVQEALRQAPQAIEVIIYGEDYQGPLPSDIECIQVSREIEKDLQQTETSQGIFAVIRLEDAAKPKEIQAPYLFLDGVQDPGNLGTMVRTAAAAGFQGLVLGGGTVDMYNDKALRSGQGAHFAMDIQEGDLKEWIDHFQDQDLPVYGTALSEGAVDYRTVEPKSPYALIMGNEGAGMSLDLMRLTDLNLYIPISDKVESLNVAMAAGIIMFQLQN